MNFWLILKIIPKNTAIYIIKAYQKFLSPDHSVFKYKYPFGFCRFKPTCSDYSITALEKHGFIKGGLMSIWRVLRCNPFNKGGWDPVK